MVVCSSLISFNPRGSHKDFEEDSDEDNAISFDGSSKDADRIQIQLAHFSFQEFLLSDRCAFSLHFQSHIYHTVIAESCLHYLFHLSQDKTVKEKEVVTQYPLSLYAALERWQHLQTISGMINETLLDLTSQLLTKEVNMLTWVQLYDMDRQCRRLYPSVDAKDLAQPLYYAARIGISAVVEKIVGPNIDINARGGYYGNALQAASVGGHEAVVKTLLDAGANVNARGGYYGSAPQAASVGGHEAVVKMLLDAMADVNTQEGDYGDALRASSDRGHETVVKVLLGA